MFEDMLGGEQNNPFVILQDFLKKENIEMKTGLTILQIKTLMQIKVLEVLYSEVNATKDPYALLSEIMEYYLTIVTSLDGRQTNLIVKGLTEMKEGMLNPELVLGQLAGK